MLSSRSSHIRRDLRADHGVVIRNPRKIQIDAGCWLKEGVIVDGRSDRDFGIILRAGVTIRSYSYIDAYGGSGFVEIGENSGIGQYVYIGGNGGVHIGRDVMISGHCFIVAATHGYDPTSLIPYAHQPEERIGITIGDRAWIAANSVIADGVTIGPGAVVGAGSVVRHSLPAGVLAAGNPAKIIRAL